MATGCAASAVGISPAPAGAGKGPRRPSLALQPFAWIGLQILPIAASAAEQIAVVPPPLPGLHRTAPFRVAEYDQRCRLAVAALEAAMRHAEEAAQVQGGTDPAAPEMDLGLDLSDLAVSLPPGMDGTNRGNSAVPEAAAQRGAQQPGGDEAAGAAAGAAAALVREGTAPQLLTGAHAPQLPEVGGGPDGSGGGKRQQKQQKQQKQKLGGDEVGPLAKRRRVAQKRGRAQPSPPVQAPPPVLSGIAWGAVKVELQQDGQESEGDRKPGAGVQQQGQQQQQRGGSDAAVEGAGISGGDGGLADSQRQQQRPEVAAWWEALTGAAEQLGCLKAVLQAASRAAGGGAAAQKAAAQGQAGPGEQPSGSPAAGAGWEEAELQEEVERGDRVRQRMLAGGQERYEDDGNEGGGRKAGGGRRRRAADRSAGGVAGQAAAAGGAYGSADQGVAVSPDAAGGENAGGGRPGHVLSVAAAAAVDRIRLAVSGGNPMHRQPPNPGVAEAPAELQEPSLKDEVVVWVVVCGPGQPQVLHEEFLMLGSQNLAELRDVMGCATEDAMREAAEVAVGPEPPAPRAAAAHAYADPGSAGGGRGARGGGRLAGLEEPPRSGADGDGDGGTRAGRRAQGGGAQAAGAAAQPSGLPPSHGSYVFLEGRFYRDERHEDAEDYTEPIRALCSAHGVRPTVLRPERSWRPGLVRDIGVPIPAPAALHSTRFSDLTLRQANHPTGMFCHRACCEHLIFVRDVRRWHQGDPASRTAFPLRLRVRDRAGVPVARRRCGLCEAHFAELVTHDDPLAPSNPAIMCRHCFDLLHIGSNGERLAPSVVVQPYNPALDIATQGTWAQSAAACLQVVAARIRAEKLRAAKAMNTPRR